MSENQSQENPIRDDSNIPFIYRMGRGIKNGYNSVTDWVHSNATRRTITSAALGVLMGITALSNCGPRNNIAYIPPTQEINSVQDIEKSGLEGTIWDYNFSDRFQTLPEQSTPITDFVNYNIDWAEKTIDNVVDYTRGYLKKLNTPDTYTVQEGDTLWRISEDYIQDHNLDCSIEDLIEDIAVESHLDNPNVIWEGLELTINPYNGLSDFEGVWDYGPVNVEPTQRETLHYWTSENGDIYQLRTPTGVEVTAQDFIDAYGLEQQHETQILEQTQTETGYTAPEFQEDMIMYSDAQFKPDYSLPDNIQYEDSTSETNEYNPSNDFIFSSHSWHN